MPTDKVKAPNPSIDSNRSGGNALPGGGVAGAPPFSPGDAGAGSARQLPPGTDNVPGESAPSELTSTSLDTIGTSCTKSDEAPRKGPRSDGGGAGPRPDPDWTYEFRDAVAETKASKRVT